MSSSWVVLGCCTGTAIPRGARTPVAAPIGIPMSRRTFLKNHLFFNPSTRGSPLVTRFQFFRTRGCPLVFSFQLFACCSRALLASISRMPIALVFTGYHFSDTELCHFKRGCSGALLATISVPLVYLGATLLFLGPTLPFLGSFALPSLYGSRVSTLLCSL